MKSRLRLFLWVFIGFAPLFCEAQNGFSHRSVYGYPACIFCNIECREDDCFITGVVVPHESNRYLAKLFNLHIDQENHLLDSTVNRGEYGKDYFPFYGFDCLAMNDCQQLGVTGYTFPFNNPEQGRKILFSVFDSQTQTEFVREYSDPVGNQYACGRAILPKGKDWYILAGVQDTTYDGGTALYKLDSMGNLLWRKYYGADWWRDEPGSLLELSGNRYALTYAHNNLSYDWSMTDIVVSNAHIVIVDSMGNILKEWQDSTNSTFVPRSLIRTLDGGYLFVTEYLGSYINYPNFYTFPAIVKLDSNLNKLWIKRFGRSDEMSYFHKVVELPDSSLVLSGTLWADTTKGNTYGWFMKLTPQGDTIWSKIHAPVLTGFAENTIYDFEVLSDGSFLGVGQSRDPSAQTQGQQGWIIRLNSEGDLDTLYSPVFPPYLEGESQVLVYPNPAQDHLVFDYRNLGVSGSVSIAIYEVTGRKVAEESRINSLGQTCIDLHALPDGLYILNGKWFA